MQAKHTYPQQSMTQESALHVSELFQFCRQKGGKGSGLSNLKIPKEKHSTVHLSNLSASFQMEIQPEKLSQPRGHGRMKATGAIAKQAGPVPADAAQSF